MGIFIITSYKKLIFVYLGWADSVPKKRVGRPVGSARPRAEWADRPTVSANFSR